MITNQTKLEVVDNSSALIVKIFKLGKNRKSGKVGDIVKGSVVTRKPSKLKSNLRRGEIVDVLILETKSKSTAL